MDEKLSEILKKQDIDRNNIMSIRKDIAAGLASLDIPASFEMSEFCKDELCHTAFHILIKNDKDKYTMVLEVSKFGPYSKIYWFKDQFSGKKYFDRLPSEFWGEISEKIKMAVKAANIQVLTEEEQIENISDDTIFETPVGKAGTVGQVLFYYDGRHV